MFHFPAFPPHALCVQAWVTGFKALPGFPIRKSSDHSSVDSSPRHIAASHVLHRLLVPRHPPCALNNLATKMLASTVQFSTYGRPPAEPAGPTPTPEDRYPTTTGPHHHPHHPPHQPRPPPGGPEPAEQTAEATIKEVHLTPSGPNSVPRTPPTTPRPVPPHTVGVLDTRPQPAASHRQRSTHEQPDRHAHPALALDQPTPNRTDQPDAP